MTALEIKAAAERLKIENTLSALYAERMKIQWKIEALESSGKQLKDNPEHYFEIQAKVKEFEKSFG